jgi:DNA-directed RNA polymerase subunit RPC12/RpoP
MELRPCDLCGCLVDAPVPPGAGESLICHHCLRTRHVREDRLPSGSEARRYRKHVHKFRCIHCGRKLRSKSVKREVQLDCPSCSGQLLLGPGGTVRPVDMPLETPDGSKPLRAPSGSSDRLIEASEGSDMLGPEVRLHETQS